MERKQGKFIKVALLIAVLGGMFMLMGFSVKKVSLIEAVLKTNAAVKGINDVALRSMTRVGWNFRVLKTSSWGRRQEYVLSWWNRQFYLSSPKVENKIPKFSEFLQTSYAMLKNIREAYVGSNELTGEKCAVFLFKQGAIQPLVDVYKALAGMSAEVEAVSYKGRVILNFEGKEKGFAIFYKNAVVVAYSSEVAQSFQALDGVLKVDMPKLSTYSRVKVFDMDV